MTTRSGPRRDGEGGWNAIVAIADVSFYVRPGSELDREARARGNSVYFPDRVVPMLPEELSADICSLKEGEDRAAMACHLRSRRTAALKSWRFTRAKIRVAANIAYEDAQAAMDAAGEERIEVSSPTCSMPPIEGRVPQELVEKALKPLWACWRALFAARQKRDPLELDLPERRVMLDEKGRIASIAPRDRLDAHRLVEDYMIAANVAAARALEAKKAPVMYRVHEPPSREKLVALKDYLKTFGIEFALGQVIKPGTFNRIIERVGDGDGREEIMEQLLRTQMQARYAPERLGHFGLALATYAHFTSPIRRYADLLVHRSLVDAYKLGEGGLPHGEEEKFEQIGEQISMLERRAMEAERETIDRYVAAYLADQVGQLVECRITGVQPFGFFATVEDLGGDGLVLRQGPRPRIFPLRRGGAAAGRRRDRRDLPHRAAADAAPRRGQSGLRLAALRASRGQLRRRRRVRAADRHAGARPPGQHPPPVEAAALSLGLSRNLSLGAYWARPSKETPPWPTRSRSSSAAFARTASTARSRGRSARFATTISTAR